MWRHSFSRSLQVCRIVVRIQVKPIPPPTKDPCHHFACLPGHLLLMQIAFQEWVLEREGGDHPECS